MWRLGSFLCHQDAAATWMASNEACLAEKRVMGTGTAEGGPVILPPVRVTLCVCVCVRVCACLCARAVVGGGGIDRPVS